MRSKLVVVVDDEMNEGSLQIKRRNAFSKEEAVPHTRAGDCGIYSGRRQKKKIRNAHLYAKMVINTGVIAYQCLTCAV